MDKKEYIAEKMREFPNENHIDRSICGKCKRCCCKIGACQLMTCDISDMSVEGIRKMLDTNKYSVYLTFGFLFGELVVLPVICAKEIDAGRVKASFFRKQCALLGENGCSLSDEERPTLGLLLIPNSNDKCRTAVNNEETFLDWYPHKSIMDEVVFLETGKTTEEIFDDAVDEAAEQLFLKITNKEELTDSEILVCDVLLQLI